MDGALPEIMDCQFCLGPADVGSASGLPAVFKFQVHCHKCGMRGPPALGQDADVHPCRGASHAIHSWNRLQALVAKGRLWSEGPDAPPSSAPPRL